MHLGLCLQPVFLERTKQNHIYYPDSSKVGENEYSRDTEKEKDREKKRDIENKIQNHQGCSRGTVGLRGRDRHTKKSRKIKKKYQKERILIFNSVLSRS